MGYYSDAALTLRREKAAELVRKAKAECESAYKTLSAAKIVDHDKYVSFLECEDYLFKRIGEEYNDIDERMCGEDYDMVECCMIVRDFEIGSSKGGLTIDKLAQEGN